MKYGLVGKGLACAILAAGCFTGNAYAGIIKNDLGGSTGFGENTLAANDDESVFIDFNSAFDEGLNFFGTTYTGLHLNNNGNVTFAQALGTFTPFALTGQTNNPIIAAFFADVDTRGGATTATDGGNSTGSNLVYWDLDPTGFGTFTATWDDVGYFGSAIDKLNAFQMQIIGVGNGDFDISITYEDINWTTGNASGGTDGLGGTVARGGWNSGNGTDFEEFGWSGDQAAALNLENTDGHYTQVRNGVITDPVVEASAPSALGLLGLGLLAVGVRRRVSKK